MVGACGWPLRELPTTGLAMHRGGYGGADIPLGLWRGTCGGCNMVGVDWPGHHIAHASKNLSGCTDIPVQASLHLPAWQTAHMGTLRDARDWMAVEGCAHVFPLRADRPMGLTPPFCEGLMRISVV